MCDAEQQTGTSRLVQSSAFGARLRYGMAYGRTPTWKSPSFSADPSGRATRWQWCESVLYEPRLTASGFVRRSVMSAWVMTYAPTIRRASRTYSCGGQWSVAVNSSFANPQELASSRNGCGTRG